MYQYFGRFVDIRGRTMPTLHLGTKRKIRLVYKFALIGILVGTAFVFVRVVTLAGAQDAALTRSYEQSVRQALTLLVVFVCLVEIGVRFKGGATFNLLFWAHILFAVPLLVILVILNFWLIGTQNEYHVLLAYVSTGLFVGTLGTGVPMIISRF